MNNTSRQVLRHPATWLLIATTLLCGFEGLYTHPYRDIVGVKTVCYGATAADHVDLNRTYTAEECRDMLENDIPKYDAEVQKCVHVDMPPHRHAAIVSFAYNVGTPALCRSSVARYLNAGLVQRACDALLLYNRAGGRPILGLTRRRQVERTECLRND